MQVANNAASQSHALTTEGLFQLSLSEPPKLILDAPLIFENNFKPVAFVESRPGRWVFLNDTGTQIRMVEGSTNSNLELDTAAPGAKLFRGPSGALLLLGVVSQASNS